MYVEKKGNPDKNVVSCKRCSFVLFLDGFCLHINLSCSSICCGGCLLLKYFEEHFTNLKIDIRKYKRKQYF